jgi:hypothetical protein
MREKIKETDKILAGLPANPRQAEVQEVLDVQAGSKQKKAVITSHVDGYAVVDVRADLKQNKAVITSHVDGYGVVDLHPGARQTDDAALRTTESVVSS